MIKLLLIPLLTITLQAKESDIVKKHCKGIVEHKLKDKTRIDCLTKTHAIEYDYAYKWHEAIGQSLYYAKMTNKKPKVILIAKKPSDRRYVKRFLIASNGLGIELELIKDYK